ncbi:replication factor RFC1 C terminal domain-domain-containing protein [Leucosporidium creatinivorum]|uniref:Replication factor C subunit 1 n=1 Tax=Leucosporidium creatinivorum TaxID=106004 RepID=A0A1Y2EXL8_9BASI|nr:replication factor RFC1 C terminal domain-domain-containing protein [Leucosporidium creatinivorum]
MSKSKAAEIILSDSDDDTGVAPSFKAKPKASTSSVAKKRAPKIEDSDSDAMDVDVKPKKKSPAKSTTTVAKKRKSKVVDSDATVTSTDEEDVKPKKARVGVAKPGTKPVPKKAKIEDSDDDEDVKGKGKAKAPPAKKPKVVKDEKPEKPKWTFKAKTGPANPGSKDIPAGEDNCLAGLTFVFTGELESLSREAGQDLAKRYGGRVTTAPSSKTSYVVLGTDAGPKKLEMIAKHKIKTLTEDQFLELIGSRPSGADDPKFIAKQKEEAEKVKKEAKAIGPKKDDAAHKTQLWTVKYAPSKLSEICGNKGSVEKLERWLTAWPKALKSDFKKPGPDAMGAFRCVLISGPPGIGKTTAAHLIAKLQGYDVLELNASDVRSKKLLETAFRSKISDTTLSGFFKKDGEDANGLGVNRKSIIIMDEVDGMSAGDRGGVGALNAMIRKTKVPIIAICNDKSSPKMKPLTATCFNLPFKRPSASEIRSRMMSVAFKEGIKVDGKVMDQLVAGSQSDIRQIVNMLSTWKLSAGPMDYDSGKKLAKMNEKNAIQTPWTLYSKLTAPQAFGNVSGMTLNDKQELYFQDHQIMPLFVQENYIKNKFQRASGLQGQDLKLKNLELMANASEAISDGDLVDRMIHGGEQQWSLMPVHGIFSCVRPAYYTYGPGGYPTFPAWFGKNSTQTKLQRLLGEIQIHMRLKTSGDRKEIRQSYLPTLFEKLVRPIQERGTEAVEEVIELMDDYYITKEDWDTLVELGVGEGYEMEPLLKSIATQTKSAFTRKYNAGEHPIPFYRNAAGKPKKVVGGGGPAPDFEDAFVDDDDHLAEDDAEEEDVDDVAADKLIKNKIKKPKKTAPAGKEKAPAKGKKAK